MSDETGQSDRGRSETGHVGLNTALWGAVAAMAVGPMLALPTPWWVWAGGLAWLALWLTALLGLSDGASRAFLSGTLRKSTYTQIYTTLTRRNVMGLWRRVCAPADDRDGVPSLFRAALTWRLWDAALLIALAYPALLFVGQWVVTGEAVPLGTGDAMAAAAFWPERAAIAAGVVLAALGPVLRPSLSAAASAGLRRGADLAPPLSVLLGIAVAVWVAGPLPLAVQMLAAAGLAVAFAPAFAPVAAAALAAGLAFGLVAGLPAFAALALAAAAGIAVARLDAAGRPGPARLAIVAASLAALLVVVTGLGRPDLAERGAPLLFLLVLPLVNAVFDAVSYAVTLAFLRRGLRAGLPLLWGLADLAVACLLFLALGATLVAALHGLNLLAGAPLVDLGALFAGIHTRPGDYWWLYLMLFSTMLPTALHVAVSLLGLQGAWPRGWRRPVADRIAGADAAPRRAVAAALALSLVWWLPLALLGAALWGGWKLGGGAIRAALGAYFDGLLWIAQVPVGAF